jgi:protein phosphatase 1 regulatory subunit 7
LDRLLLLNQLYLSENGLTKIEGLEENVEISTLDLANNKICVVENIEHLSKLEEFWVRKHFVLMFNSSTANRHTLQQLMRCCSQSVER